MLSLSYILMLAILSSILAHPWFVLKPRALFAEIVDPEAL
jgi:hypothetical protein